MGIAFDEPPALLLLPVLLAFIVLLHAGARRRRGSPRRVLALLIRLAIVTGLVFALAGLRIVLPVDRLATVFVVDLSDSVGPAGHEDALAFLREALDEMPDGDMAGVVAFGKEALVERLPSELATIDRLASAPLRTATDIGAALRLASALFPDDAQKRIVLLSDGNDTTGAGQTAAALAAARGVRIETRLLGGSTTDEVLVERLAAPSTARLGEEIELSADIRSSVAQTATMRLFADGVPAGSLLADLEAGTNRVVFQVTPTEAGFHTFRVVVEAGRDTFHQNDRADAHTIVKGEPRIVVAAGDEDVAAQLVAALEAERQQVDSLVPEALPADLPGLASYDSVVLVDVPRSRLTDEQQLALQVYVRDLGRGLVMVGGPRAYGAGGYTKTAIEETLPVDMGVRDRQKQPDVSLVVVIDKSGSMDACHCNTFNQGGGSGMGGVRKVDIGKEAILRAAAALTARDRLGVVAFNEASHWVVQTSPLGSLSDLGGSVAGINPDGQTNIFAGLDAAIKDLEAADTTRKHIILLTDGWSSSGDFRALVARAAAAGITLSTVGAGGGSNPLLEQLARDGGGRYYNAVNVSQIPDIFLKETQQVAGQQIVEEAFHPIQSGSSPILRGLEQGLPQLLGYNGTTAKPAAQTVLVTARDDPLLAQWQYGLGRSVAWTSDATGRWAKAWIGWDGFARFFSQLVSWTFPGEETGGIEGTFVDADGRTTLRVESVAEDGSPRDFYATTATIVGPDLSQDTVSLAQTAPGVYETDLGEIDPGAYAIRVSQQRAGSSPLGRTLGLVAPTAAEYRLLGSNEALLTSLRSATGGGVIETPAAVWAHDLRTTTSFADLWPLLLVLALLLWPLDIALRRVSLSRRELAAARSWVGSIGRRRRVAPRTATVDAMLATRERAGGAGARAALVKSAAPAATAAGGAEMERSGTTSQSAMRLRASPGPAPSTEPSPVPPSAAPAPQSAPDPESSPEPSTAPAAETDTVARLREAKRRARER
jgi:uncharacterized membrane protein